MAEKLSEHLHIKIDPELREAVQEWRHAKRIGSESEAVRRLIQRGLDAEAADRAKPPRKG